MGAVTTLISRDPPPPLLAWHPEDLLSEDAKTLKGSEHYSDCPRLNDNETTTDRK
jgi:hypothetical protein